MPVRITCRNVELPDSSQQLVVKKSQKLKKFFEKVDKIDVVFSAEKHRRQCEIIVHAGPFKCTATAENERELVAFDQCLKAAVRQIKESKTKMIDRKHKTVNPAKMTNKSGKPSRIKEPDELAAG